MVRRPARFARRERNGFGLISPQLVFDAAIKRLQRRELLRHLFLLGGKVLHIAPNCSNIAQNRSESIW